MIIAASLFSATRKSLARNLFVATLLWLLGLLYFFRDPERIAPRGENLILSPADGKIINIDRFEHGPIEVPGKMVSIFMSPLDVHINRAPVTGRIQGIEHRHGSFRAAYLPEATENNERNTVLISSAGGKIAMRQVAGFLARRIVFHPRLDQTVYAGDRVGIIKFGSRVDLFLPESVEIHVQVGQSVRGAESIIGEFTHVA